MNEQHVFDDILLFKDIIQYVQYAMTNILQWILKTLYSMYNMQ